MRIFLTHCPKELLIVFQMNASNFHGGFIRIWISIIDKALANRYTKQASGICFLTASCIPVSDLLKASIHFIFGKVQLFRSVSLCDDLSQPANGIIAVRPRSVRRRAGR